MGHPEYDSEGRVMRIDFPDVTLLNVYFPSGASKPERQAFKLQLLGGFSGLRRAC